MWWFWWTKPKAVTCCRWWCTASTFWQAQCCRVTIATLGTLGALLWGCCHVYISSDMREVRQVANHLDWEQVGQKHREKLAGWLPWYSKGEAGNKVAVSNIYWRKQTIVDTLVDAVTSFGLKIWLRSTHFHWEPLWVPLLIKWLHSRRWWSGNNRGQWWQKHLLKGALKQARKGQEKMNE